MASVPCCAIPLNIFVAHCFLEHFVLPNCKAKYFLYLKAHTIRKKQNLYIATSFCSMCFQLQWPTCLLIIDLITVSQSSIKDKISQSFSINKQTKSSSLLIHITTGTTPRSLWIQVKTAWKTKDSQASNISFHM